MQNFKNCLCLCLSLSLYFCGAVIEITEGFDYILELQQSRQVLKHYKVAMALSDNFYPDNSLVEIFEEDQLPKCHINASTLPGSDIFNIHIYRSWFNDIVRRVQPSRQTLNNLFSIASMHNDLARMKMFAESMAARDASFRPVLDLLRNEFCDSTEAKRSKFPSVMLASSFPETTLTININNNPRLTVDDVLLKPWLASLALDDECRAVNRAAFIRSWTMRENLSEEKVIENRERNVPSPEQIYDRCATDAIALSFNNERHVLVTRAVIQSAINGRFLDTGSLPGFSAANIYIYRTMFFEIIKRVNPSSQTVANLFFIASMHNDLSSMKLLAESAAKSEVSFRPVVQFLNDEFCTLESEGGTRFPTSKLASSFPDTTLAVYINSTPGLTVEEVLVKHWLASLALDDATRAVNRVAYIRCFSEYLKQFNNNASPIRESRLAFIEELYDQCAADNLAFTFRGQRHIVVTRGVIQSAIELVAELRIQGNIQAESSPVSDRSKKESSSV